MKQKFIIKGVQSNFITKRIENNLTVYSSLMQQKINHHTKRLPFHYKYIENFIWGRISLFGVHCMRIQEIQTV